MWHTYTEKEHILRSMRSYFAYVYANGAHVEVHDAESATFFIALYRFWGPWGAIWHTYTEKEHILRSMRGYFAYVYANGAHVELSELQKAQ
jgi:ABC-type uncharacterized transport system substrate-binding protein